MFINLISLPGGYFVAVVHEVGYLWGSLVGRFGVGFFLFVSLVGLGLDFYEGVGEGCLYCNLQVYELLLSPFRLKDISSRCLLIIFMVLNHAYECFQFCRVNGLWNQ